MHLPSAAVLGPIFGVSEVGLSLFLRAKSGSNAQDKGSLRILWLMILAGVSLAIFSTHWLPGLGFPDTGVSYPIGVSLFFSGLLLRWFSIIYLGRFFTVNVAIAEDHRVIDTGPYRYVRHPSYTGALLAFIGYGICLSNFASLVILLLPVFAAFLNRIRIEESALSNALGAYMQYCKRTKRLIPYLY
jgi:protein-S-isoprenylcysteine O-methyltransferase